MPVGWGVSDGVPWKPLERRAVASSRASRAIADPTAGPLGVATVVVGGVGVALVLVVSELEPQPASANKIEQTIRT